ncbi:MAG: FtsH protease activity modulator HflK [Clostridium sp.]|nr:FtsH protease activity modulator HflK [Clostridium sp.]
MPGKKFDPQDLFERIRRSRQTSEEVPGGQKPRRNFDSFRLVLIIALVLFVVRASDGAFFTLNVNESAVVTTLGRPVSVTTPGVHFKIPFVQNVVKMSREIQGMTIGYDASNQSVPSESEMITKDFNFVNVDFYIEYQMNDPVEYYIHMDTAYDILRNLAQSYIRDTVGVYNVDDVITTGKAEIQSKIKTLLSERMEKENVGLGVVNVTIQDAEPPTAEVISAFRAVEDAKQGMDTRINEANKYASEQIPAANARADKVIQDAEAYRQERISEAEGQAARFNDMYREYQKYPLITKKRMLYETLEQVLPDLKVIINSSDGTQTMLPLEPFVQASVPDAPQ